LEIYHPAPSRSSSMKKRANKSKKYFDWIELIWHFIYKWYNNIVEQRVQQYYRL
jgi:hypothetical protein